jgi:transaldolase
MDMELCLDTADIGQIEEAARLGVLGGVTTNPTLLAGAGQTDTSSAVRKIAAIVAGSPTGTVSMECIATDADGMALVRDIVGIYRTQGDATKVLAASLRHPMHVVEAARAGADLATMPYTVFKQLINHPLTDSGPAGFLADREKVAPHMETT